MEKDASAAPPPNAETSRSVLIVDDEEGVRSFLSRALERRGWRVATAGSAEAGADQLERGPVDLIILDVSMPGKSGLEWLREIEEAGFPGEVILITAFADMNTAIDALRAGASDFVMKPFRIEQIINAIDRCFERAHLARENYLLRRQLSEPDGPPTTIIGKSDAMDRLRTLLRRVAPTPSTVLIQGESGVGKELVARSLHNLSQRADRPFVPVNCAAISSELIEAELFGHVRGAFTGAKDSRKGLFTYANGGTLFLDEIAEFPLSLQPKLLRALENRSIRPVGGEQEMPVDVRVVAATNRDLKTEVARGTFRQDLYYRLEVMTLSVPPLRQRLDDLPELVTLFMRTLATQLGTEPLTVSAADMERLCRYSWPGNVRELRNFIERSLLFGELPLDDLGPVLGHGDVAPDGEPVLMADVERAHILSVLARCDGNKARAAELLGLSRKTLDRKCAEWGV